MIWEIDEASRSIEGLDERGRARPEYAASLGLVPAPFGRRALAATIEAAVYVVLQLPMLLVALPGLVALTASGAQPTSGGLLLIVICAAVSTVLTTAYVMTQLALHGRRGVTLGKAITGLRSVNVRTLERPGFWRGAVVRALVLWGSFAVPLVGPVLVIALSPFFDGERRGRGWPDLAAATWFVDVRRGLNPYDVKRMRIARKTVATDLQDDRSELPSLATPVGEQSAAAAYIPTSRSSGGVLGALRADGAAADEARPDIPLTGAGLAPAQASPEAGPSVAGVPAWSPPAADAAAPQPSPVPQAGPAAAPAAGGAAWVPPRLMPDAEPAAPAGGPRPSPAPVPAPSPAARAAAAPSRQAPSVPAPAVPTPPVREASATLTLDDGGVIEIRGSGILIGRDPASSPGDPRLVPVALADPSMSVSKTHLAVIRAGADLVAIDLGSTNGTAIVRKGVEHPLTPREQVALRDDDTIRLGDRHARLRIG
ncbi:RDD family protein [Microbacterium cremeum]|uniref:RDD family protein n=1 Tax=Microbacterium cremeum TaxID=2782169 RepID=UPI0018894934|nr:RDD family protein [Microbacterium cremeum]